MRNSIHRPQLQTARPARAARMPNGKSRRMPGDDVTITAAAFDARIGIAEWLDAARGGSLPGGLARALPGGAQAAEVAATPARTVALSDGTRITFARVPRELESA